MDWHTLELWIVRLGVGLLLVLGVARIVDCEIRALFRHRRRAQRRPSRLPEANAVAPEANSPPTLPYARRKSWKRSPAPR